MIGVASFTGGPQSRYHLWVSHCWESGSLASNSWDAYLCPCIAYCTIQSLSGRGNTPFGGLVARILPLLPRHTMVGVSL